MHRARGFTLVELMVVLVVLAMVALVALPSYNDSVRKSRRAEAMSALAAVQQAQERWRGNNASYTTSLSDLNLSALASGTSSGYYAISVAAPSEAAGALATGYIATAVGKSGTSQAADSECRKLSVRLQGGNLSYAGCGSCESFTYTATHACWVR